MNIQKISPVLNEEFKITFKAAKIKKDVLKSAKRSLKHDVVDLRETLPKNKNVKKNKLYGYDPTGRNSNEYKDFTAADAVGLGAMFALGLAASLL